MEKQKFIIADIKTEGLSDKLGQSKQHVVKCVFVHLNSLSMTAETCMLLFG